MTFDDGIVTIYDVQNGAKPGDLPINVLVNPIQFHFAEQTLGVTRYYEAIKANQLIERVITIYPGNVTTNQVAIFEDGSQYSIRMIQRENDDFGIKILRLSLERNGQNYEIAEQNPGTG